MTAGYSGTPLSTKLGLRSGHVVALLGAPPGWSVPGLPPDVVVRSDLRRRADVILAFIRTPAERRVLAARAVKALPAAGSLWVAWPRKAGGHVSDVTEQSLRDALLPLGLVDTKVAALDEDWSGLRFVWRKELRSSITRR
jgi:hypothetical protein